MKDIYISDLSSFEEGRVLEGFFLLLGRQLASTQTNKQYLRLTLGDKTGSIDGVAWELSDGRVSREVEQGEIVKVRAEFSRYKDKPQIKIIAMRKATASEADPSDMMPATQFDVTDLWRQLQHFIAGFTDPDLKRLLLALGLAFRQAPAAKQLHHAWLGGLLEHVVSLLKLADLVAGRYPILHRDLLLTGVILHDIGKTKELSWAGGFEYTLDGMLLGHIQIGSALAERTMDALPNFPPKLKTLVLHMILSHHGKLEFGSPKLPMTPEALALSFVDDLDAKMQAVESEFEKTLREGKSANELTGKVWALDQRQLLNTRRWLESK
jgi:3'-5' exoribonuclease